MMRRIVTACLFLFGAAGCQKAQQMIPAPVPRALSAGARYDGEPHVSPDGTLVVYSAFGAVDRDLFVVPLKGGETRLLYAGPGNDERPRWSPDGRTVAFSSDREGSTDVWTVAADGTGARPLTFESGRDEQPDWAPGGDLIAFISDRGGRLDLWTLNVTTGAATPLTASQPPVTDYHVSDPAWAGGRILFAATLNGPASPGGETAGPRTELFSIAASGGPWTALLDGPSSKRHPALSPDGRLAFVSDTTSFWNVYVREADGRITTVTESRTDCFDLAWTPDGRSLVYTRRSPWALLAAPLAGADNSPAGGASAPAVDTLLDARGGNFDPTWSPDALEIAYESDLAGQHDIWRLEVGEGSGAAVSTNRDADGEPDWSKSNRICFSAVRNGNSDIWIMDPSGIEFFNVTNHPARDRTPRWSPDGREILFVSDRDGNDDIWIVPATGGDPRRLTDDPAADRSPTLTANAGTPWVVFESLRSGTRALWRMPLGGGPAVPVTKPGPGEWDGNPAASPAEDGLVVFTHASADDPDLYAANVFRTEVPRRISGDPANREDNGAFSPDGKRIAFQSGGNFDLWTVEVPVPAPPTEKASR